MTPDEYRVSKVTGEVLHRAIGPKLVEYVPRGGRSARTCRPSARRPRASTTQRLGELVEVARRVERHFGSHQDIEWAIDRDGTSCSCCSRGR